MLYEVEALDTEREAETGNDRRRRVMLFDTHAHLNDERFDADRKAVIQRARENGVSLIVNVGFDHQTITDTIELAEAYEFIYAAVGWHPNEATHFDEQALNRIEALAKTHPKVVAIGETGLDYYRDYATVDQQQYAFRRQIDVAKRVKKPLVIHNREASSDVVAILTEEGARDIGGVMHCFSGDLNLARQCLDLGFYLSFGGPLTFKNAQELREVARYVPQDRILIETDCPYLAPHPLRGKRNESAYVRYVAEELARLFQRDVEEMGRITLENGKRLFGIMAG
jgi:TatD DNase family protein